jgi:hypothetical protein
MSFLLFQNFENSFLLAIGVFSHNLEGSKKLGGEKIEFSFSTEVLQGYIDGGWFPGSILRRNLVILQRLSSEQNFSSVKFQNCVHMGLNLSVIPRNNRTASQVLETTLGCLHGHFLNKVSFCPVFVHEHN